MSQNGMSRDELEAKLEQAKKNRAQLDAQIVENARDKSGDAAKTNIQNQNLPRAIAQERGLVQRKCWVIIELVTGEYVFEEIESKRSDIPTVGSLFKDADIAKKYNPNNVVSIQIFTNQEEAEKEAIKLDVKIKDEKEKLPKLIESLITSNEKIAEAIMSLGETLVMVLTDSKARRDSK